MTTMLHRPPSFPEPVPLPGFEHCDTDSYSFGQIAALKDFIDGEYLNRLANPATAHEFARFITASGSDWGALDTPSHEYATGEEHQAVASNKFPFAQQPKAPDDYHNSMPAVASLLKRSMHRQDAALTFFASHLQIAMTDQTSLLGVPEGIRAFRDSNIYLREFFQVSGKSAKRIITRLPFLTYQSGESPLEAANQPSFQNLSHAFQQGNIPAENIDSILRMEDELTKYTQETGNCQDYKDAVLQAFEPTLLEAGQHATPDELSREKSGWVNTIAHSIDADGPPVAVALRKEANNAMFLRDQPDGSGKMGGHFSPEIWAIIKTIYFHSLNKSGTPPKIPAHLLQIFAAQQKDSGSKDVGDQDDLATFLGATQNFGDLHSLGVQVNPQATAIDQEGQEVAAEELELYESLTAGQRFSAVLLGMLTTLLSMSSDEIGLKRAHGAPAKLVIIQDIQTAYTTLSAGKLPAGALPEEAIRPQGTSGLLPPIIARPNPDERGSPEKQHSHPISQDPPQRWTGYFSEALNTGPIHPKDTTTLMCDAEVVGQIWNGHHTVLEEHRAHRLFTPKQRQTILARDRGCQAPGCTIPAAWCQIHHIVPWLLHGPTNVDNAIVLCAHHHAAVHNEKWVIKKHEGVVFFQPAPWINPEQPLLRNLYWNG